MNDRELLRRFIDSRDEQAFAELVRRYIDLVYSAARRQTDDSSAAEEVTHLVFIKLAQKARAIRSDEAIGGWLLAATRSVAFNERRAATRRRRHKSETASMKHESDTTTSSEWRVIGPALDEGISQLAPADRDALTIRYLENRSFADVALALGVSEEAARKRVGRAVIKLREWFAQQGVTTTAEGLPGLLLAHALTPAPASLAGQVASAAFSAGQLAAASMGATKGTVILMAMSNTKAIAITALVALVGIGTPVAWRVARNHNSSAPAPARQASVTKFTPSGDWKKDFQSVYALEPGQNIKLVPPPFVPARDEFVREMKLEAMMGNPESIVMASHPGGDILWQHCTRSDWTVAELLRTVAKIWPQDTLIPRELLATPYGGDWVVRDGATQPEIVSEMTAAMADVFGAGITLIQQPQEREAIVVRGRFEYRPVSEITQVDLKFMELHFHRGETSKSNSHDAAQTMKEMLQFLGELTGRPVAIEAEFNDNQPFHCVTHLSADFRKATEAPDEQTVKEILAALSKQTCFEFTLEKRTLPTWIPAPNPQ